MTESVHDDLLFSMLKECKTLPIFLDHIFGFLNRRTDFYHVAEDPKSPLGLPPGLAEQTVKNTFYKYRQNLSDKPPETEPPQQQEHKELKVTKGEIDESKFAPADSYNGAVYETYSWSQTLLEIDIIIKIPDKTSAKELDVQILPDKLAIKLKSGKTLLEGVLCDKCKHSDAIWSLNANKLEIHLDKTREIWWNCMLKTEPKLDISKMDCSRPYEDLPEEAKAKIEEMKWNQERKRLGLPTSDEINMHSMLRKSWNTQGSPFTGPFDPSSVQFK